MERLWIANIAPDTTDDELKALVAKYAREPLECIGDRAGRGRRQPAGGADVVHRQEVRHAAASSRCA